MGARQSGAGSPEGTHSALHVPQGGCVDTQNQSLALLFMVLGAEDVSKIRLGKLSPFTIQACCGG
jgi:hypothetical protein